MIAVHARQLGSCVRRELRAHVVLLPATTALVPLVACALASLAKHPPRLEILAACCAGTDALFFGSQILACELRDEGANTIAVLRRIPAGLGKAVVAKLLIVVLAVAATLVIVHALAPSFRLRTVDARWNLWTFAGACALGATSIAASTWLPRASLALPTAFLVTLLLAAPTLIAWAANPWVRPSARGVALALGIALPALALVALVTTTWLMKRERSDLRVGLGGASVFGLAALPLLAIQLATSEDRVRLDSPSLTIDRAYLSPSGRVAWLTCRNQHKSAGNYLLRVDLETSELAEYGNRAQRFEMFGDERATAGRTSLIVVRDLAKASSAGTTLDAETGAARREVEGREQRVRKLGRLGGDEVAVHKGQLVAIREIEGSGELTQRVLFPFETERSR